MSAPTFIEASVYVVSATTKRLPDIETVADVHQAMVLALTGKNRARWSGKQEESAVFNEWLAAR
ncbi:MAG TPA: hypothetical protein VK388_05710 [Pyrinomonadaceae bacterium]|nr:hypothetical protein [Pyrinomonadaceae bacterium]